MDSETGLVVKEHADAITDECYCKETIEPSFRHDQSLPLPQSEIKSSSAAPVSASNVKLHVGKVQEDASTTPGAVSVYTSNVAKDYQSSQEFSVHDTRGESLHDIENGIVKQETMVPIAAQVVEEDKDVTEMLDTRIRAEVERLEERVRRQILTGVAQADIVTSPTQTVNDEHPKGHCASMKRPKVVISLGIVFLLVLISIIVSVVVVTSKNRVTSPTPAPVQAPVPSLVNATCGEGNRGNGVCADGMCCSQYGYCGIGTEYCGGSTPAPVQALGNATCGEGSRGNGVCADEMCCSQYGYCGIGTEYCGGSTSAPVQAPVPSLGNATCGGGSRGNGVCADEMCCSQYGYCGIGTEYCDDSTTAPVPVPTSATDGVIGYYRWTWSSSTSLAPSNLNLAVAFSGEVNVTTALSESSSLLSSLNGVPYLGIGGGDSAGYWTSEAITNLNSAIAAGQLGEYKGICYVIEQGDSGLSQAFADSFATAKQYGFMVLVAFSQSAPYGFTDARTLVLDFFANTDIDYISPQLFVTGEEAQNYVMAYNVAWSEYNQSHALIVPSIVQASYYSDAQTYFSSQGITLSGFIQWKNAL